MVRLKLVKGIYLNIVNKKHNHCIDILIHPKDTRRVKLEKVKIKILK